MKISKWKLLGDPVHESDYWNTVLFTTTTQYIEVPGGYLYRTTTTSKNGTASVCSTFVPFQVKEESKNS